MPTLSYLSPEDRAFVLRAAEVARTVHAGQLRKSGESYEAHAYAIATMLADMNMDAQTIAAGLLHDTLVDTILTPEDIRRDFGDEVLFLIQGVTKLGAVRYHGNDKHNESLRRLFIATSRDIRVVIIKLVERLHNMRTLAYLPHDKQIRIARETLEIYVPIAHRLSLGSMYHELEDLAFPYALPEAYERVRAILQPLRKHNEEILDKCRKTLQRRFVEAKLVTARTDARVKSTYSLYHKLNAREWNINNIHDYLAVRVIVPTLEECYHALGIVHELWKPIPGRIKDYIAFPKPNGYRSLHTTVITPFGRTLEIQIRTEEMHREAELGVAAHIAYKTLQRGGKAAPKSQGWFASLTASLFTPSAPKSAAIHTAPDATHPNKLAAMHIPQWIKEIAAERTQDKPDEEGDFDTDLHSDFFSQRIFVFTPKGDVIDLPIGATPIDFAYTIHSDIAAHAQGAEVNGKFVALDTPLNNGDIVAIITQKNAKPSAKWLTFVKTASARRKIRGSLGE